MKFKSFATSVLLGAGLLLGANDKKMFDATIKHVDLGGTYLQYQNVAPLTAKAKELPVIVYELALKAGASEEDAILSANCSSVVVKVIKPQVVKAAAASSVTVSPDCHVMKQFIYCNTKAPSFLDFLAKTNRPSSWQTLPANTKFAVKSEIHLGTLYNRIVKELLLQRNPKLKLLPLKLLALKKEGIDVEAILNSLEGEIELLVCGDSLDELQIKMVIPDKNGAIAPILQGFLPPQPGSNQAMLPLPMPNGKMPLVVYGQNQITLVTDDALLKPVTGKTLASLPQFAAYAKHTPAQLSKYMVVNFDKNVIAALKVAAAGREEAEPVLKLLSPFSFVAVGSYHKDGLASTVVSSFSIPDAMITMPYKMSALAMLPALQKARGKAQQVQCVSNLKQLGVGLAMYAIDHNNTFPATLDALKKDYMTDDKVYLCPQSKTPYVYLGGGVEVKKMQNASQYPVLFDAPGCGHKAISVCFADGHVTSVEIPDYKNPAQVIGVLNKQFHYAPEMLSALLAKIAQVK